MKCFYKIIFPVLFILISCTPKYKILRPSGTMIRIEQNSNLITDGELICVGDSVLYIMLQPISRFLPGTLDSVQFKDIKKVSIAGFSDESWGTDLLIFQVLPGLALALTASSVDSDNFGTALPICMAPPFLSFLFMSSSTPSPIVFDDQFDEEDIHKLRLYARYPYHLSANQINSLGKYSGAKRFKRATYMKK